MRKSSTSRLVLSRLASKKILNKHNSNTTPHYTTPHQIMDHYTTHHCTTTRHAAPPCTTIHPLLDKARSCCTIHYSLHPTTQRLAFLPYVTVQSKGFLNPVAYGLTALVVGIVASPYIILLGSALPGKNAGVYPGMNVYFTLMGAEPRTYTGRGNGINEGIITVPRCYSFCCEGSVMLRTKNLLIDCYISGPLHGNAAIANATIAHAADAVATISETGKAIRRHWAVKSKLSTNSCIGLHTASLKEGFCCC